MCTTSSYTEKFGGSSAVMSLSNYAGVPHIGFSFNGEISNKQKIRQCIETLESTEKTYKIPFSLS